jgi:Ni/Co efflux regulator RcnB
MTKTNVEVISRRRLFSVLGIAAAASVAAPMLTLSDAEAQTLGMERRHERRVGRHERRTDRREDRHDRRTDRRTGTTGAASTTGAAPAQK